MSKIHVSPAGSMGEGRITTQRDPPPYDTDIAIGDIVSFSGTPDQGSNGLMVDAQVVKDWTNAHIVTKLNGVITSINSTLGSFTVKHGNSTTIQIPASTKFEEGGDSATFADLLVNARVKIKGFFATSSSIFAATEVDSEEKDDKDGGDDDWKQHRKDIQAWFKANLRLWLNQN